MSGCLARTGRPVSALILATRPAWPALDLVEQLHGLDEPDDLPHGDLAPDIHEGRGSGCRRAVPDAAQRGPSRPAGPAGRRRPFPRVAWRRSLPVAAPSLVEPGGVSGDGDRRCDRRGFPEHGPVEPTWTSSSVRSLRSSRVERRSMSESSDASAPLTGGGAASGSDRGVGPHLPRLARRLPRRRPPPAVVSITGAASDRGVGVVEPCSVIRLTAEDRAAFWP